MVIGSKQWKRLIQTGAAELGISVPDIAVNCFAVHGRELFQWNRKVNLTAITEPYQVAIKHYLDAIVPATVLPRQASLLDIGSGGGFPGIPLKIMLPSLSVTLIDAARKKINFLKHAIRTLALDDIIAIQVRAEDLQQCYKTPGIGQVCAGSTKGTLPIAAGGIQIDQPFDVVISRALTSLIKFFEMALPLLQKDGMLIALKGRLADSELAQAQEKLDEVLYATGFHPEGCDLKVQRYRLPSLGAERTMVTLKMRL